MDKPNVDNMHAWLRLLRAPNLFTVPGDAFAGAALAATLPGRTMPLLPTVGAAVVVLVLYAFGLVMNDLCDLQADRKKRAERPLPSRQVTIESARWGALALAIVAGLIAACLGPRTASIAAVLCGLIVLYDLKLLHQKWQHCLCMGLCRGMGLMLGASVVGWFSSAFVAGVGLTAYIAAVTWIAEDETREQRFGPEPLLPPLCMGGATMLVTLALFLGQQLSLLPALLGLACGVVAVASVARPAVDLSRRTVPAEQTQRAIGVFIRGLMPWQAAYLLLSGERLGMWIAILLLLLWPVSIQVGRRFYAS